MHFHRTFDGAKINHSVSTPILKHTNTNSMINSLREPLRPIRATKRKIGKTRLTTKRSKRSNISVTNSVLSPALSSSRFLSRNFSFRWKN